MTKMPKKRICVELLVDGMPACGDSPDGFSLIELLLALSMFLIVGSAAFGLFAKEETTFLRQQGMAGTNVALRNASAQIEMDLYNAGTAYFQGSNIPSWPVGVTIVNNIVPTGNSCYDPTTFTYGAQCFDAINIIAGADPATYPPSHPTDSSGASGSSNCSDTSTGTAYGQAANGLTLSQTAAKFAAGDEVLFLSSNGKKMTAVVLTAAPTVSGSAVRFSFNGTNTDGTNTLANDPLDITACDNHACPTPNNFGNQFCGGDWVVKLAPITYQVDATNAGNPKLTRTQNGTTSIVMEQLIGFKVGATIWNSSNMADFAPYVYDASGYTDNTPAGLTCTRPCNQAWNFTRVRSVRISLIGRSTPNTNPAYLFRNVFDHGPYQVASTAIVVNPRNMSMND
jgi:prepilin-type N-terminal cleavage/methylation domain-containing protein